MPGKRIYILLPSLTPWLLQQDPCVSAIQSFSQKCVFTGNLQGRRLPPLQDRPTPLWNDPAKSSHGWFPFSPNQHQANSANCRKRSSTGILDPNHINGLGAMVHHAVFHTESLQMESAWLLDSVGNPNCDPTQTATLNHPTWRRQPELKVDSGSKT